MKSQQIEKKKHLPSECPLRGYGNGTFGCTECMPITSPIVSDKLKVKKKK